MHTIQKQMEHYLNKNSNLLLLLLIYLKMNLKTAYQITFLYSDIAMTMFYGEKMACSTKSYPSIKINEDI